MKDESQYIFTYLTVLHSITQRSIQINGSRSLWRSRRLRSPTSSTKERDARNAPHSNAQWWRADIYHRCQQSVFWNPTVDESRRRSSLSQVVNRSLRLALCDIQALLHWILQAGSSSDMLLLSVSFILDINSDKISKKTR